MTRRRLPDNVHHMQGSYRSDRHGQKGGSDIELPDSYPEMPQFLEDHPRAKTVWVEIQKIMEPTGLYTSADALIVARFCVMQAEYLACPAKFTAAEARELRALESQLYLNPEARQKLGVKPKRKSNPFDKM